MTDKKKIDGSVSPCVLSKMPENTPILVGFSGGADSRALLELLICSGAEVYAAHVNHGIRGDEAIRDREFCRAVAEQHNIRFFCIDADVPTEARECRESIETAARRVRYDFFMKIMRENGIPLLATAHNADDNLETLLFNIARGSSANGLCGIPSVRDFFELDDTRKAKIIRPLLNCSKRDILRFCEENGYEYVTDSTNSDTEYSRNRIRHNIVPQLEKLFPSPQRAASRLCADMREDCDFINSCAEDFCRSADERRVEVSELARLHTAVLRRVLVMLFGRVSDATLESVHLNAVINMIYTSGATERHRLSLPDKTEAFFRDGYLGFFCRKDGGGELAPHTSKSYCVPLKDGETLIAESGVRILCNLSLNGGINSKNIYKLSIKADINFDKIIGQLYVRSRSEGDKIKMNGMSKKLKKLFCDKKVPTELRDRLPIVCERFGEESSSEHQDERIIFVPFVGYCDGARYCGEGRPLRLEILIDTDTQPKI